MMISHTYISLKPKGGANHERSKRFNSQNGIFVKIELRSLTDEQKEKSLRWRRFSGMEKRILFFGPATASNEGCFDKR